MTDSLRVTLAKLATEMLNDGDDYVHAYAKRIEAALSLPEQRVPVGPQPLDGAKEDQSVCPDCQNDRGCATHGWQQIAMSLDSAIETLCYEQGARRLPRANLSHGALAEAAESLVYARLHLTAVRAGLASPSGEHQLSEQRVSGGEPSEEMCVTAAMILAAQNAPDCNSIDCNGQCAVCKRNELIAALAAAEPRECQICGEVVSVAAEITHHHCSAVATKYASYPSRPVMRCPNCPQCGKVFEQCYNSDCPESAPLRVSSSAARAEPSAHELAALRIKANYADRAPFCPDHRDKVAGKPCRECEIERLSKPSAARRDVLEDKPWCARCSGTGWTEGGKTLKTPCPDCTLTLSQAVEEMKAVAPSPLPAERAPLWRCEVCGFACEMAVPGSTRCPNASGQAPHLTKWAQMYPASSAERAEVLEEAAKVADAVVNTAHLSDMRKNDARAIAAAIRALLLPHTLEK